jgi:hypothetical protein
MSTSGISGEAVGDLAQVRRPQPAFSPLRFASPNTRLWPTAVVGSEYGGRLQSLLCGLPQQAVAVVQIANLGGVVAEGDASTEALVVLLVAGLNLRSVAHGVVGSRRILLSAYRPVERMRTRKWAGAVATSFMACDSPDRSSRPSWGCV